MNENDSKMSFKKKTERLDFPEIQHDTVDKQMRKSDMWFIII